MVHRQKQTQSPTQTDSVPDTKPGNIFDAFAKNVFGRVVVFMEFLRHYADPKFLTQIDLAKIKPAPTHVFGKNIDERIVDLVFECPLVHGGSSLAIILFEHQTGSLREIPRKLLKYIGAIWEAEWKSRKRLSAPYFIVLRTGKRPCKKPYPKLSDYLPRDEHGVIIGTWFDIPYDVIDLPALDVNQLLGPPELRLVLGLLKNMSAGLLDEFPKSLTPIREFRDIAEQRAWFVEVLPFIAKVFAAHHRRLKAERVNEAAQDVFEERSSNMMPTIFEEAEMRGIAKGERRGIALGEKRGIELGEKRGIAMGEVRGKARGKAEAIQYILTTRFRRVPKRIASRLLEIGDLVVLDSLTVAAVQCASLKEFEEALG
ncbi:MAG: Rpn family recombination-promoting nuclease/putative transposase [Thermoguttaceae bacterium]